MPAEIKDTNWSGVDATYTAETYAIRELACSEGGQVERAAATADNVAKAFGRLLDTLADRGGISSEDAKRILRGY